MTATPEELIFCGDRIVTEDAVFHDAPFHDHQFSRVFFLWKDVDEKDLVLQKEELESVL